MHNRIMHPVLRQIEAIVATEFETIEKQSATAKSNLDYLAISWMAKLLIRFDKHIPLRLARLFSALVQNSLSSTEDGLAHLQITSLKALFNSAQILLASGALDRGSFKKNIDRLLLTLENSNWMSSLPLASYAVYGLKGIASDGIVERARAFIMKCLGPELEDAPFRYPEVALALPHFCSSIEQHKSEIEQEFASGAYQRGALLLFIISEHQEEAENRSCSDWAHGMLGEFENRTNSQIADVNRPGLSLIGLALLNLGLDIGYLLNARDYSAVQSFFESNTVAVPIRTEYIQETIVLGVVLSALLLLYVRGVPLLSNLLASMIGAPLSDVAGVVANFLMALLSLVLLGILLPWLAPQFWRHLSHPLNRAQGGASDG